MHYLKTGLIVSVLIFLGACQDKPATDPDTSTEADAEIDPKLQALLDTPVSELTEDKLREYMGDDYDPSVLEKEPAPAAAEEYTEAAPEYAEDPQYNEEFELKVYRQITDSTMTGYIDKIDILSLNDQPTTIKNVVVNRGNCRVISLYDYQNMRYGSAALAYPRCNAAHIREVAISTAHGTYTYRIG